MAHPLVMTKENRDGEWKALSIDLDRTSCKMRFALMVTIRRIRDHTENVKPDGDKRLQRPG